MKADDPRIGYSDNSAICAELGEEQPNFSNEHLIAEFDLAARPIRVLGREWIRYDLIMGNCERRTARDLVDYIDEDPGGGRIADLGSGTGVLLGSLAARFPEAQIRAVDISAGMLRACAGVLADRIRLNPPRLVLVRENALNMATRDASYDLVVSTFLLDLMESDEIIRALTEIKRVLRRGGAAYLAVMSAHIDRGAGIVGALGAAAMKVSNSIYRMCYRSRAMRRVSRWLLGGYYTHCRPIDLPSYVAQVAGLRIVKQRPSRVVSFGIPILPVDIVKVSRE